MRTQSLVLAFTCCVLGSCQAPEPTFTEDERAQAAEEVLAALTASFDACAALDVDRCFGFFSKADWVQIATQGSVEKVDAFRPGWADYAAELESNTFLDPDIQVQVLSPTLALTVTAMKWASTYASGVQSDTVSTSVTNLWIKEDGTWKVGHTHQSFPRMPKPVTE